MSAVLSAEPSRVADQGRTGSPAMPLVTMPRRWRPAAGCSRASARAAIRHIQSLMREHGITPSELGVAYALSRIRALMDRHRIFIEELRDDALAPAQKPPRREMEITHCPQRQPRRALSIAAWEMRDRPVPGGVEPAARR